MTDTKPTDALELLPLQAATTDLSTDQRRSIVRFLFSPSICARGPLHSAMREALEALGDESKHIKNTGLELTVHTENFGNVVLFTAGRSGNLLTFAVLGSEEERRRWCAGLGTIISETTARLDQVWPHEATRRAVQ